MTLSELVNSNILKKGDYIKIPYGFKQFVISHDSSGYDAPQYIRRLTHKPVIAQFTGEENECGSFKFLGEISFNIMLNGKVSCFNRNAALTSLCKHMFDKTEYGIFSHLISEKEFDAYQDLISLQVGKHSKNLYISSKEKEDNVYGLNIATISEDGICKHFLKTFDNDSNFNLNQTVSILPVIHLQSDMLFKADACYDGKLKSPFPVMIISSGELDLAL